MTAIHGYDMNLPISMWGGGGKVLSATYLCPADENPNLGLDQNDRRCTAYNVAYESFKYLGGRSYTDHDVFYLSEAKEPSLSILLGDCPPNGFNDGRAGWFNMPKEPSVLKDLHGNLIWASVGFEYMGVRFSHSQDTANNVLYFDGHANGWTFPDAPEGLTATWMRKH